MARGKQTDTETVYKIMLSMFATNNFSETGRRLGVPTTTVENIYKANKDKEEFVKLRNEKRGEFVEKADKIINKAMERLLKELDSEDKIAVNNLSTVIGTLYDKKKIEQVGKVETGTPEVNINIIDNSVLEKALYEEEEEK